MGYRRLALTDRYQIQAYLQSGLNVRAIAKQLGISPSTVSREVRKCKGSYSADFAQEVTLRRNSERHQTKLKIKGGLANIIRRKLLADWSPEQITGRMRLKRKITVSHQTIYRFIAREKLHSGKLFKHLRILKKQRKDRTKPGWKPHPEPLRERTFIEERPKIVDRRERLGDVERDTVYGKKNGPFFLTIVDRRSRLLRLVWLNKKSSHLIHDQTVKALKNDHIKTITNDNGTEFAQHQSTAKALNAKIYFSNAYRAWERGTNENLNGLLRQYFPKKTHIGKLTKAEVKKVENRLNTRPRKCLGYLTPLEVHNAKCR